MKSFIKYTAIITFLLSRIGASAQHEHHQMKVDTITKALKQNAPSIHHMDSGIIPMSHSFSLNLPMSRNGSGTSWLPDTSPMYGYRVHSKKWMYMFHGNIFIRYNQQDIGKKGVRGDSKVDAPSWFMAMGQRRIGQNGLLHFNTMFSLDPLFGGSGYPLLFQTGETYKGDPLIDRQHPHDLISELSIAYTQSFSKDFDAFVYFGYPGEPALGPTAFMHRPSALNNPDATLGHHWSDATHVTFGVATIGFRFKIVKLDGSLFTGREPDEARYGFDKAKFDSYSYRITINPLPTLSAQFSKAFINSPEAHEPDENIDRTTASLTHSLPLRGDNHFLLSTFVWGFNDSGNNHEENSYTIESNIQFDRLAVYGRFENIQKSASELLLSDFEEHELFNINAVTIGLNYTLWKQLNTNVAIGAQGTLYSADNRLDNVYGNNPKAFEIYLRISPCLMSATNRRMDQMKM